MNHDLPLNHVTVLEEAHNILKRTNKDQSQESANIVGKSVEMISNSIKEMRTYGEGFIIIDQSPMAIDATAIENTSTKIIFNTPTKDACEEMGNALSLTEEQIRELSRLSTGVAAVFQKGWLMPVLMKVDLWDPSLFEAEVRVADLQEIRDLRGRLADELYRQSQDEMYSPQSMRSLIQASAIDKDKKKDFIEIVDRLNVLLQEQHRKLTGENLGRLFLMICNCDGLFAVINDRKILGLHQIEQKARKTPEKFSGNDLADIVNRCRNWKRKFMKAFAQYATVTDRTELEAILKWILQAKYYAENDRSPYYTIFALMQQGEV